MPRNSSGTASQPASTSAIADATIDPDAFNTLISDIYSELTASLPVNGSKGMTASLPIADGSLSSPAIAFTSDTNTGIYKTASGFGLVYDGSLIAEVTASGLLNASSVAYSAPTIAWTDVASATTTDLGAQANGSIRITGTTTITGFGTVATGTVRFVRFAGALTLTHNSTSLILPGAANITTAANDSCIAISLGSGNWIVLGYQKASGLAVVSSIPTQTGNSGYVLTTDGSSASWLNPPVQTWAVHAWAYFDSRTGSITSSNLGRCTVARNSTGNYTVTFTTAFAGSPAVSVLSTQPRNEILSLSTSAFNFRTLDASGTLTDSLCTIIAVGL